MSRRRMQRYGAGILAVGMMGTGLLMAQAPAAPTPAQPSGRYQPKFAGDPARSESEAQALGYMRTVLRAQHDYKKRHNKYAESLEALAGTGSFTKRMAHATDRGDYTATFLSALWSASRRVCAHHDAQADGQRPPLVLRGRRWGHSCGRSEAGRFGFSKSEVRNRTSLRGWRMATSTAHQDHQLKKLTRAGL